MVNVIKQEVRMEESLRKRLEFICEFCKVKPFDTCVKIPRGLNILS